MYEMEGPQRSNCTTRRLLGRPALPDRSLTRPGDIDWLPSLRTERLGWLPSLRAPNASSGCPASTPAALRTVSRPPRRPKVSLRSVSASSDGVFLLPVQGPRKSSFKIFSTSFARPQSGPQSGAGCPQIETLSTAPSTAASTAVGHDPSFACHHLHINDVGQRPRSGCARPAINGRSR